MLLATINPPPVTKDSELSAFLELEEEESLDSFFFLDGIFVSLLRQNCKINGRVAAAIKAGTISVGYSQENKTRSEVAEPGTGAAEDIDEALHEEVRQKDEWSV